MTIVIMGCTTTFQHYRFYNDDGTGTSTAAEANCTPAAAQDTGISYTIAQTGVPKIFRVAVDCFDSACGMGRNVTLRLEYSYNSGADTQITTGTSPIALATSATITNGQATTNRLTLPGGDTFAAGTVQETSSDTAATAYLASQCREWAWVHQIANTVSVGDTIDLKVYGNLSSGTLVYLGTAARITIVSAQKHNLFLYA